MRKILLIALLFLCNLSFAQDKGTVTGTVTDKEFNNEPLAFASVFIKGTSIGSTTDMDGKYTIAAPAGNQVLVFSFVGYKTIEKPISVVAGKTITINQILGTSGGEQLEEVQINATVNREKESALLLEQKKASVIKESIGAQELSKKGVSDAAGAVTKISGVSKQEGSSNVYVRGLGDRYLNTTLNGLSLPSNNINKKNIDLNLFSSDVIQNISISKAYSSNFYGDFAAGNVDISSKEYKGKGFVEVSLNSGINTNAAGKDFFRNSGPSYFGFYNRYNSHPFAIILSHGVDPIDSMTPINVGFGLSAGKSFNFKDDSKLSLFFTGSFGNSFEFTQGPAIDFTAAFNKGYNSDIYKYGTNTTLMGTAFYKINANNKLKFTSLFINNSSDEIGFFGLDGLGRDQDSPNDDGSFIGNYRFNQDLVFVNQITGTHKFDEKKLQLDWGVGYNNTFSYEPDRKRFILNKFDNLLDNDPNTNASFSQSNSFNNQRYFQNIRDEELNSRIEFKYQASESTQLNFGYNGKVRVRDFDNSRYGYKNIETTSNPLSDHTNLNSIFNIDNFFNGVYQTHVFNPIDPSRGLNQTNLPGLTENRYQGNLSIYAGYFSANINIDDKWLIVPGIRIEGLEQSITYDAINLQPGDSGRADASETFFLPSLSVKYSLNDDTNLRFAASKTVSVPEFKEIAIFVYEDVTQRIGGNPDLLGGGVNGKSFSDIYNIDLKYEWFMEKGELLSFGAFAKFINDPINLVLAADATATQRYFRTGEQAKVFGAEVEVQKNLILNEDEEPILSGGLNVTYMNTEQDLYETITTQNSQLTTQFPNRTTDQLEGASEFIVNADLSYKLNFNENFKTNANLVFAYASDRIFSLGSGNVGNIIEKGVPNLDFVLKNDIGKHFQINVTAKNLLDPEYRFFRESTKDGDIILNSYNRGITLGIGLKYKF